ncbi:MAG: phosphoribosylformylglycinamidine synthase subunit PurS, partial [Dehalococcoidia bacterium]
KGGLETLGFASVQRVRAGKYMEILLEEEDLSEAQKQVREMCHQLLANPVIEDYRFELEEVPPSPR